MQERYTQIAEEINKLLREAQKLANTQIHVALKDIYYKQMFIELIRNSNHAQLMGSFLQLRTENDMELLKHKDDFGFNNLIELDTKAFTEFKQEILKIYSE